MKDIYETLWGSDYRARRRQHGKRYDEVKYCLNPSSSLADWGCGQGRVAQMFADDGLDVIGIDIASNSLDDDVKIEFICGELKDVYFTPVEYSMCLDVLEHLEHDDLKLSVDNIMSHTNMAAYFKIACVDDYKDVDGRKVNLHRIVEKSSWWRRKFNEYTDYTIIREHDEGHMYNIILE